MKKLALFAVILTFSIMTNAQSDTIEELFKKDVDIKGKPHVSVLNTNGNITIESWDNAQIRITADKETKAADHSDARELMDRLKIEVNVSDDQVKIYTLNPDRDQESGFFSWLFGSGGGSYIVNYTILVPKNIGITIRTANGNIRIENCRGKMDLKTTNGNIKLNEISGSIRCRSTNGSLKINFADSAMIGDMSFETTNGNIKIYLPNTVNTAIAARTVNGHITCDLPLIEIYEKSAARLKGVLNKGGAHLTAKTVNGNIILSEN
jgi:DUF4097 and DUF4098 domain-containing protein YvlB